MVNIPYQEKIGDGQEHHGHHAHHIATCMISSDIGWELLG
jgi:hypothetical protein